MSNRKFLYKKIAPQPRLSRLAIKDGRSFTVQLAYGKNDLLVGRLA